MFKPKGTMIEAASYRVKYKDIFEAKAYYEALREWIRENGFHDGSPQKFEQYENHLHEKITPGGFKEMIIRWRTQRTPEDSTYFRYHLDLDFLWLGVTNTEVVRDGVKFKAQKGEVEVTVKAQVELDYEGKWEKHWFLKHVIDIFQKRIFQREIIAQHRWELYRDAYNLQNYIKNWFKMNKYLPYEETKTFFSSKAWPSHAPK